MKTSEVKAIMENNLAKLVRIFCERNTQYSGEEDWNSNFKRNAELAKILRLKEIIEYPYGRSIQFIVDKVDRMVNLVIMKQRDFKFNASHLEDSIDDAIVYLFITKQMLREAGFIEDEKATS